MQKRSSILLFSIITTFFYSFNAFADDTASSTFSIDVSNAALQVTAPATASIELNPTSSSAVFGSTNITVNVATNNTTGYTITMTVPTTDLTHSTITGDNAPVIPTLQSAAPQSTFPVNAWGYKVTGDNYNPILLSNTNPSWQTENPTNGTDHIITLAAKVDGTKHSGTYTNTLTFNVVANPVSAKDIITFDKNNENASGTMGTYTVQAEETKNLPANTFVAPAGYHFTGWSTTANGQGSNVRFYGDTAPYTATDTGVNKQVTLYAQWSNLPACVDSNDCDVDPDHVPEGGTVGTTFQRAYEIAYTALKKGMYEEQHEGQGDYALVNSWTPDNEPYKNYDVRFAMQDMTPEICASVTAMHDDYQALDVRDNKLYHITKLKDGKCWMTQNLDFDITGTLDSTTTDLVDGSLPAFYTTGYSVNDGVIYWTPRYLTNSGWDTTQYNISNPRSLDVGDIYYDGVDILSSCDYSDLENCTSFSNTPYSSNGRHGHIGNFYNWMTATATNDPRNNYDSWSDISKTPQNSICPKNWRLPMVASQSNEYMYLLSKYNVYTNGDVKDIIIPPLYFVTAGQGVNPNDAKLGNGGRGLSYWSSSERRNYNSIYANTLHADHVFTDDEPKNSGLSVRCLAR
jgi:uncharacterized protein (TIGR02145 family)